MLPPHDQWESEGKPPDAVYIHTHRKGHDDFYRLAYIPGSAAIRVMCDFDYYECTIVAKVAGLSRGDPKQQMNRLTLSEVACEIRNHWIELINGPASQSGGVDVLLEHLQYDVGSKHDVLSLFAAAMFGGDPGTWRVTVVG